MPEKVFKTKAKYREAQHFHHIRCNLCQRHHGMGSVIDEAVEIVDFARVILNNGHSDWAYAQMMSRNIIRSFR